MNIEDIKTWLKQHGVSRREFAEKVGVKITSVNNWLSGYSQIPAGRMAIIEKLLAPPPTAPAPLDVESVKVLVIRMTAEQRALCVEAARKAKMDFEDWARAAILSVAEADLKKAEQSSLLPRGRRG